MTIEEYRKLTASTPNSAAKTYGEDDLQKACVRYFGLAYPECKLLLHHSPNEGLLPKTGKDGAKRKAMGVRAGFPDLILLVANLWHHFMAIELKTTKGKQTASQKAYQKAVERAGGLYVVIRTTDDFIETVANYMATTDFNKKDKTTSKWKKKNG